MDALYGKTPGDEPAHGPWLDSQIIHARFVRARVLAGKWSDGESPQEFTDFLKYRHVMPDDPRQWTRRDVREFERVTSAHWTDGGLKEAAE